MIQARYGWTDQQLFDLSAARFLQICSTVLKAKEQEARDQFILQAYNAWQIIEVIKGIASDKVQSTSFKDYLKKLGLNEKQKLSKLDEKQKEQQTKQALSIAEQIKLADQSARK